MNGKSSILIVLLFSANLIFISSCGESENSIKDIDGNIYKTIKIGDQTWMAENLKVTRYRNGESIGTTHSATQSITGETKPEYHWAYGGDENNVLTYGRLYTWYAINDSRGICPVGWHVPTDEEWNQLEIFLQNNGYNYDGSKDTDNDRKTNNKIAKSLAVVTNWTLSSDEGAVGNNDYPAYRNKTGFSALPGGHRGNGGRFFDIGEGGHWWSLLEYGDPDAWAWFLYSNYNYVFTSHFNKKNGFSVRCVKDQIDKEQN